MPAERRTPTPELRAARRTLETIREITLLRDWQWHEPTRKWTLHCRLSPDLGDGSRIAPSTDWYVLVDGAYPWGSIKFYPAKAGGLVETFPHQSYNGEGPEDRAWRTGDLCLSTSVHVLGRHGRDVEPYEAHSRLRWHAERAIKWLVAAAQDKLVVPGDPFELPQFPLGPDRFRTVVFSEGTETFAAWQSIPDRSGRVDIAVLRGQPVPLLVVKVFRSVNGSALLEPHWGELLEGCEGEKLTAIWLRLDSTPVLSPWQAPATWQELRIACRDQGIDLDELLRSAARCLRDGRRHIALVGFPIPATVGGVPQQMHWQAMELPVLSWGTRAAKGFRTNELGYWQRDRMEVLRGQTPLEWLSSENWHAEQLSSRGRLPESVTSQRILVLGAGALGSAMAELLVRAGAHTIRVADGERLEAGNLVRHTLDLEMVKSPKASSLSAHLNRLSPHAATRGIDQAFPPADETACAAMRQCDVILDCTGQDEMLHHLEHFDWGEPKLFISVSVGVDAQRLFCFSAVGTAFPHAAFRERLGPWLWREEREYGDRGFPREGVGCWNPVFPARVDDVWLMGATALKHIEAVISSPPARPELAIFEQVWEDGLFVGVRRVDPEGASA